MLPLAAFYRKLREELSRKILQLVESGEMHSLKEKWWDARRRCLSDGDDEMATTIKREGRCKEMAFILGMKQMGEQLSMRIVMITVQSSSRAFSRQPGPSSCWARHSCSRSSSRSPS